LREGLQKTIAWYEGNYFREQSITTTLLPK